MTRDVIFPIASMTKPVVAVGTMILQEEGRLSVSDPVGKYLPELDQKDVAALDAGGNRDSMVMTEPARRQPTIQDLMRHTAGFTAPLQLLISWTIAPKSAHDACACCQWSSVRR